MTQDKAEKYYTIYQITNLLDGKIYIGKHVTSDLDDGYMGSGKLLLYSQEKYGIENFKKEILFVFDNEQAMNDKERELVTAEFVAEKTNYNFKVGGEGGFGYINDLGLGGKYANKQKMDLDKLKAARESLEEKRKDPAFCEEFSRRVSEALYKRFQNQPGTFTGKTHTEETRQKLRGPRPASTGENNSQYGTRWITDDTVNRKIKKTDQIPDGWRAGRVIK